MPIRWLGAWSNGANGSEWSWSIRSHGGGKTSVSSLGVWDKRNLPYDALQRGVLSPLQKPTPERDLPRGDGDGGVRDLHRKEIPRGHCRSRQPRLWCTGQATADDHQT